EHGAGQDGGQHQQRPAGVVVAEQPRLYAKTDDHYLFGRGIANRRAEQGAEAGKELVEKVKIGHRTTSAGTTFARAGWPVESLSSRGGGAKRGSCPACLGCTLRAAFHTMTFPPTVRVWSAVMRCNWGGVFPAAVTHFHDDQSLDLAATQRHLDAMIAAGVHGLIMLGTVGENCSLEYAEKLDVLRATVEHVRKRVPVLAGVAECSTALACRFAADARKARVDGLMVLPAMVYKSDARETVAHCRAVAAATDLPILCYNNPVSYGVDITPEMFADLADEPKFVAIKESSENVRRVTDLKTLCGDRYRLFCGVDDLILESV